MFLNEDLGGTFSFTRKQLGQLASKMRYVAAQFEALLDGDLWLRNARQANAMAQRLEAALREVENVEIAHPVEANFVFARFDGQVLDALLADLPGEHPFHVWDEATGEIRLVCAWDTRTQDVDRFASAVSAAAAVTAA